MKSVVALICVTALLLFALYQGQDGIILAAGIAVLAGLGGFIAPHRKPPS